MRGGDFEQCLYDNKGAKLTRVYKHRPPPEIKVLEALRYNSLRFSDYVLANNSILPAVGFMSQDLKLVSHMDVSKTNLVDFLLRIYPGR